MKKTFIKLQKMINKRKIQKSKYKIRREIGKIFCIKQTIKACFERII